MNQIPNIEEVGAFPNDPTGLRREFAIMFHRGDFIKDGKDNSELISDWFHQQLQKAREEAVTRAMDEMLEYTHLGEQFIDGVRTLIEARGIKLSANHSELDQEVNK